MPRQEVRCCKLMAKIVYYKVNLLSDIQMPYGRPHPIPRVTLFQRGNWTQLPCILRTAHESAVAHGHSKNPYQAAKNSSRKAYGLINTSAGKLSWLTKRRIILSVKGRVRFKMSATRPRGPMIGSRSLRLKP